MPVAVATTPVSTAGAVVSELESVCMRVSGCESVSERETKRERVSDFFLHQPTLEAQPWCRKLWFSSTQEEWLSSTN